MEWEQVSASLDKVLQSSDELLKSLGQRPKRSWLSEHLPSLGPAIIAGVIGIATTALALNGNTGMQERQRSVEIASIKFQIVQYLRDPDKNKFDPNNEYSFNNISAAKILLQDVLHPIDESPTYKVFEADINAEFKKADPDILPQAPVEDALKTRETNTADQNVENPTDLVKKFGGDDRLSASNRLIQLYDRDKETVVKALIEDLEANKSYRTNLYVAFTLGRIEPGWEGKEEQDQQVKALKSDRNYQDPTFKKWVDEAIRRFKLR